MSDKLMFLKTREIVGPIKLHDDQVIIPEEDTIDGGSGSARRLERCDELCKGLFQPILC